MSKKTIYIAGLGLIGSSLALGIRRDHPDYRILGYNGEKSLASLLWKKVLWMRRLIILLVLLTRRMSLF